MKIFFWNRKSKVFRLSLFGFVLSWCISSLLAFLSTGAMAQQSVPQKSPWAAQLVTQQLLTEESEMSDAESLNEKGASYFNQGQSKKALETWQEAASAFQSVGDEQGFLRARLNQIQALKDLGFYQRSLDELARVSDQVNTESDVLLRAIILQRQGDLNRLLGELDKSRQQLDASLSILQKVSQAERQQPLYSSVLGASLFNLGELERIRGQQEQALKRYQQTEALSLPQTLRRQVQLARLQLLIQKGDRHTADLLWPQLHQQLTGLPNSRSTLNHQISLADCLLELQSLDQTAKEQEQRRDIAVELLRSATQQSAEMGDLRSHSYALGRLGRVYEQAQQWSQAARLTQEALNFSKASNAPELSYRWLWQQGRIALQQDQSEQARMFYREALSVLRSLRQDLAAISPEVQFSFREDIEPLYREFVSLLLQEPNASPAQLTEAQQTIESLQLAELENFLRKACDFSVEKSADQIDDKAAIIYPIILPNRLEILLGLPHQPLHRYTTVVSQIQIEKTLQDYRKGLVIRSRQKFYKPAQDLYQWLIQPIADDLKEYGIETLVFVPDSEFKNVPLAALHNGHEFLIEEYKVVAIPSLQLLESQPLPSNNVSILAAGISQAKQGFSPLSHVTNELRAIKSLSGKSKILLDEQFTTAKLQAKIQESSFPIVHLATHGQFSSDPNQTFMLAWDDTISIQNFDQLLQSAASNIELLVLSACETAQGDRRAALGLTGVAMEAGTRSTLATLWFVNDAATAKLITTFYRSLLQEGATRAEALREAQLTLLRDRQYNHPIYWAPFIMIGNWL